MPKSFRDLLVVLLTTKSTKATKGAEIYDSKPRVVRFLRGTICLFFFGCGWK
jgi:hypothetical protein